MSLSGEQPNSTLGGNFHSSDSTPVDLSIQWKALNILSLLILVLTFLLGVPGNGAVVWVTGFKMKRSVNTVCFLHLAVADLTYCLTVPFQMAGIVIHRPRNPQPFFPMVLLSAVTLNLSASIFLLTLISIYRCLAVTRPIWFNQKLRLASVRAACFGAWGLGFLMCLPDLLIELIFPYLKDKTGVMYQVNWVVFTFGVPVGIMAACYLLIFRELRGVRFAHSRKPVRLILTVVAAFIVCWLPRTLSRLLLAFSQPIPLGWMECTLCIASFNNALNPLLYVFVGRDFRQVFRRSLAASLRLAFTEEAVTVGDRSGESTYNTETRV